MLKALVVLLWPAGIAAILVGAALLARRRAGRVSPSPAAMKGHRGDVAVNRRAARSSIVGMLLILAVGAVAVYALTCLLGVLIVHAGPAIDKPVYSWMIHHRVHFWKAVMDRLTKVGNTWTTWGAAVAAATCLAAFYRRHKWLPPVVLGAAIVIDHFLTLALRHTFHRLGPPDSPLGTFPSGGCDRIILFYGLIAYLLWHEFSRQRRAGIWAGATVAALAFSEGYTRFYLTLHWFTDVLSGWVYGSLLLLLFIVAVRYVEGSSGGPGRPGLRGTAPDAVPEPAAGLPG